MKQIWSLEAEWRERKPTEFCFLSFTASRTDLLVFDVFVDLTNPFPNEIVINRVSCGDTLVGSTGAYGSDIVYQVRLTENTKIFITAIFANIFVRIFKLHELSWKLPNEVCQSVDCGDINNCRHYYVFECDLLTGEYLITVSGRTPSTGSYFHLKIECDDSGFYGSITSFFRVEDSFDRLVRTQQSLTTDKSL